MTLYTASPNPRRRGRAMWFVASSTLLLTSLTAGGSLGAQTGCGTHSFDFSGTRLLNDGISNSAGPFDIELPAGTYTVTLVADDHHDTQVGVGTQPGEQFHVILDSGYISGNSIDIPDDANTTTTTFTDQVIAESSQITVEHAGVPGINSVNPVCVGFTPTAVPEEALPEVEEALKNDPEADGADPIDADQVDVEVEGIVELPQEAPIQELIPPASIVRVADVAASEETGAEVAEVDVLAAAVNLPAPTENVDSAEEPVLAVTGSGEVSRLLMMIGAVLLALGALCTRWARFA